MVRYAIKRFLIIIPLVLTIVLIVFTLLNALPGSYINVLPVYGDGDALDSVLSFFNANNSFFTRYIRYCYNVFFHLDFGRSANSFSFVDSLVPYTVTSLTILMYSVGITLFAGIPLGVYSATRKNRPGDRIINIIALIFSSIPSYSMALLIALLFSLYLGVLPIGVYSPPTVKYIMPTLTIALGGISAIARMTRSSMLDELEQPYITALRSKGLNNRTIIYRHALKNAIVPVISALGGLVSKLLCGTFVVELFFNVRGLGYCMLTSLGSRSYHEILGCIVIMTVILVILNIIIDIIYSFLNPQIKLQITAKRSQEKRIWDE